MRADQLGQRDPESRLGRPYGRRVTREALCVPDVQGPRVHARDGRAMSSGCEAAKPVSVPGGGRAQVMRFRQRQRPVGWSAELLVRVFPAIPCT